MATPVRLYTFVTGGTISPAEVNAELDQLIAAFAKIDTDGNLRQPYWGTGGQKGWLGSTSTNVYCAFNCEWSGSAWTAIDTAKPASIVVHHGGDSQLKVQYKQTTSSPWVSWDGSQILWDNTTSSAILEKARITDGTTPIELTVADASGYVHASTAKTIVIGSSAFDVSASIVDPLTKSYATGQIYLIPGTGDDAYDHAQAHIEFPIGAELDSLTLYGYTAAGDGDVTAILTPVPVTSSTEGAAISTISLTAGATSNADTAIGHTILATNRYVLSVRAKASTVTNALAYSVVLGLLTTNLSQVR